MFPTVEVRWFYQKPIPPEVLKWFQQGAQKPEDQPRRVDYYLRLPANSSLGIKLREGKIEIKQRHRQHGVVRLHERVTGVMEHWRKWSFELTEANRDATSIVGPTSSWIGVRKERRLRKYRLAGDKKVVALSAQERRDRGCDLELTRISVAGTEWWSLGFEAFGGETTLHEDLLLVTRHVLGADKPPTLDAQDSYGYPKWLKTIDQLTNA